MTTIPTPPLPTDNLYKFVALSGLAAVVASVYFGITVIKSAGDEVLKLQAVQAAAIEAHAELMDKPPDEYVHLLGPSLRTPRTKLDGSTYDDLIRVVTGQYTEMIKSLGETLKNSRNELSDSERAEYNVVIAKLKEAIVAARQAAFIVREEYAILDALLALLVVGLLLMLVGFASWWFRLQRWQDKAIREEASPPTTPVIFDIPG